MKPRTALPFLFVGAMLITAGIAVRVAAADEHPELTARYSEVGFWDGGLIGTFAITNPSTRSAADWTLSFSLPDGAKVAGVWNGVLTESGGTYTVAPNAQTRTLAGKATTTVGFTASAARPVSPTRCSINGNGCTIDVSSPARPEAPAAPDAANAPAAPAAEGAGVPNDGAPAGAPAHAGAAAPGGSAPAAGTAFAPSVNVVAADRPPLTALAAGSGAQALDLASALPAGGACDLKWGGTANLTAYAGQIADALAAKVGLIATVGGSSGVDLAQVCGTAAAFEAQLKRLVDLGVRSINLTIPAGLLGNDALNLLRAQAVKDLKSKIPGLSIAYTLPVVGGGVDSLTAPLTALRGVGAVVDRVNVLPVDLASPLGPLNSLLAGLGLGNTVEPLLDTARALHDKLMTIQGLDSAAAWKLIGIIPILGGNDLLGGNSVVDTVRKVVGFAKANGLGLVGLLPLNPAGESCGAAAGAPALPLLGCLGPNMLPRLFALTDVVNRTLR
jgi:hypothetical protein